MKPTVDEMQTINGALLLAQQYLMKKKNQTKSQCKLNIKVIQQIETIKEKTFGEWFVEAVLREKQEKEK